MSPPNEDEHEKDVRNDPIRAPAVVRAWNFRVFPFRRHLPGVTRGIAVKYKPCSSDESDSDQISVFTGTSNGRTRTGWMVTS